MRTQVIYWEELREENRLIHFKALKKITSLWNVIFFFFNQFSEIGWCFTARLPLSPGTLVCRSTVVGKHWRSASGFSSRSSRAWKSHLGSCSCSCPPPGYLSPLSPQHAVARVLIPNKTPAVGLNPITLIICFFTLSINPSLFLKCTSSQSLIHLMCSQMQNPKKGSLI